MDAITSSKILRIVAFASMALFGLLGTLFVAGYAFEDPGGWTAVWLTAIWLVPMVGMSAFALLRPDAAAPVFLWVTPVVLVFAVLDGTVGIVPRDEWGPLAAVSVFAFGVALGFLGLHRPRLAGVLMVTAAAVQLLAIAVGSAMRLGGDGPGPGATLGGSSGVVVLPLLLIGGLFMLAGSLAHEEIHLHRPTAPHLSHHG